MRMFFWKSPSAQDAPTNGPEVRATQRFAPRHHMITHFFRSDLRLRRSAANAVVATSVASLARPWLFTWLPLRGWDLRCQTLEAGV